MSLLPLHRSVWIASAAAALAACVTKEGVADEATPLAATLAGTSWRMVSYDGRPTESLMTIAFQGEGRISGGIICNSFSGDVEFVAGGFRPLRVVQSLLGCDLTGSRDAQQSLTGILEQDVIPARLVRGELRLRVRGKEFGFARQP
jgi:hypothetical protein